MVSRKDLSAKRRKSAFLIAGAAGGNVIFSAAPKPTVEVPAHVALTLADFVMCGAIYEIYYGEHLSEESILAILGDAGVVIAVAGGGGYAIAKGASGLVAEVTNFLGPLGWMASGLLAAGGTVFLGLIWWGVVDVAYRNDKPIEEVAASAA